MAGLKTRGISSLEVSDLHGDKDSKENDGQIILRRTERFLSRKRCSEEKIAMVISYLSPVFSKRELWYSEGKESTIKSIYKQIKTNIIPLLEGPVHLDFTGRILNSLNEWVSIENDRKNDVVLTPREVTKLMVQITRTNKDSFVWDTCMGSSGFLVSAMEAMIEDAQNTISNPEELQKKIGRIKRNQLLGIEILGNIYILAVLNMILMGDGSSQIICGDSHNEVPLIARKYKNRPFANVYLLNPPYSSPDNGLIFAKEAMERMECGYGAVLIQESAGSGKGIQSAREILRHNTLIASIRMPIDLFAGKASVQTAIYLFKVNRPHCLDDTVLFVGFSNDGYLRKNRRKSTQKVNLQNVDHASERYEELAAICLNQTPKTTYYTVENGLLIKDKISLTGDDWTFAQHVNCAVLPSRKEFSEALTNHVAWK